MNDSNSDLSDFVVPDDEIEYDSYEEDVLTLTNSKKRKRIIETSSDDSSDESMETSEKSFYRDIKRHKLEDDALSAIMANIKDPEESWKSGLSQKEIKTFGPQIQELYTQMAERETTLLQIVQSNLPQKHKVELAELYHAWQDSYHNDPISWVHLKKDFLKRLNEHHILDDADMETKKKLEDNLRSTVPLEEKIIKANLPFRIKAQVYSKYKYIENLSHTDETYAKYKQYIDYALSLPNETVDITENYNNNSELIQSVHNTMTGHLYGQNRPKEEVLRIVAAMAANPKTKNKILCFIGPPGVGKTALARCLGTAINLPFHQISFGGANDPGDLKGHNMGYIGSEPGTIVKGLILMGKKNGIFYFDEMDKIKNYQVMSVLMHILDPEQNSDYKDDFLAEISIDLSECMFVISVNHYEWIPHILRDRIHFVHFQKYSFDDKVNIGLNYMTPKMMTNLMMNPKEVKMTKEGIEEIILMSRVKEEGVRQLGRNIKTVLEKINLLKQLSENPNHNIPINYKIKWTVPMIIDRKVVDELFSEFVY